MKRVILIMSLVLIYSCAFVFVKVYADKSFVPDGEPSDRALVTEPAETVAEPDDDITAGAYMSVTSAPDEEAEKPSVNAYAEKMVNKIDAAKAVMKIAAASSVSDIEIDVTEKSAETTVSETSKVPETTSKAPETTPAPISTQPPASEEKTAETPAVTEEEEEYDEPEEEDVPDDNSDVEDVPDDNSDEEDVEEEPNSDLPSEIIDAPDYLDDGFSELTEEELQRILESLGISDINDLFQNGSGLPQDGSLPNDGYGSIIQPSGKSYRDETVTVYDVNTGTYKTGSAFDIVCEITNNEVGNTFEVEAIKAQAVAAYTYIKYYQSIGEYPQLGCKANPSQKIINAVTAVDGYAMYYNGKYIFSPFSASQGGFSASSKNVWGGDLPYLQSVQNDFDYLDSTYYGKTATYTVEELRQKIESKTDIRLSENYSEWIRILDYNDHIYAGHLSIDGHTSAFINGRERTITGHIFRSYILGIRSCAFNVTYSGGVFTFTTYGYGHGVGMSQIGANLYAKNGYTFDKILTHYYTGVTIA